MSDSAREEHGSAFEASSYAMLRSVISPPFDGTAAQAPEEYGGHGGVRERRHQTAQRSADRAVQVSPASAVTRRSARWPGVAIEIVQANRRGRIDYRYRAPMHMLVVHDRGARHDGSTVVEGLPPSKLQDCSRKLVFVPAGHEYHDWHEPRRLSRTVFFYFDPARLDMAPRPEHSSSSLGPRLFFEYGALVDTALKLAGLIESGGADDRYAEALGVVLTHELTRMNISRDSALSPISGGLAAWQRRKAVAYIEERFAEPISLAALAQLVGLSACYFCRAFRRSVGMPPQRYQLAQRVERAKALLAKNAASVTDVGLSVGYNDASAFCTAFRRVTGLTPSAYRRSLG
jgi:AraC family transcriptional regulator